MKNPLMNKTLQFSRRLAGVGLIGALLAASGCEQQQPAKPSAAKTPAAKTSTPDTKSAPAKTPAAKADAAKTATPKPAADANADAVVSRITSAKSLLDWYEARQACPATLKADARVVAALKEKEAALRKGDAIKKMNASVDLVDFRWEKVKQVNPKEDEFKVTALLYVKSKPDLNSTGKDIWLTVRGTVESAKMPQLINPKEKERGYIELAIKGLKPETWPTADYVVLTRTVQYPNLPYHFSGLITSLEKDKAGSKWTPWTDRINLGWHTDLN